VPDDYLFRDPLAALDPAVAELIALETERQARKLIMIPSESSSPWAVREALGSVLMNIYAEGYPDPETRWLTEEEILDYEQTLAHYRRYGDRRYYRGVEYADVIEALARRRCAECFATPAIPPEQIYLNVQPLSGSPANAAVLQALLKPGDTIMGLALADGGHLTHGSPVNFSGRLYNAVAYHVDPRTELLDYDQIEELALEHRPKMLIAGYTAYPRIPNWAKLRQIADRVGAYLLADIAHVAGMVIAGVYPNPLGIADVITFTTHKTLCGPRGACIVTADPRLAPRIDHAVFPGLQGGPHVNKFAAMAVAFRLARSEQFRALQRQTVANAQALARALAAPPPEGEGLRVPCGGTDTHLLLLDCKTVQGRDGTPLMGEVLAAVLDTVGIVVNKNSIPGDRSPAYPSGIRLGTPWVTQRGLREPEMRRIASIIARAMRATEPLHYTTVRGVAYRGKVEFDALEGLRAEVAQLAEQAGIDTELPCSGYPHHCLAAPRPPADCPALIEIVGSPSAAFVEQLTPVDVADLRQGEWRPVRLLERDGTLMSAALVQRPDPGHQRYWLAVPGARAARVLAWLRALSDGLVRFDDADLWAKLPGPVVVRDLSARSAEVLHTDTLTPALWEVLSGDAGDGGDVVSPSAEGAVAHKPYFIGLSAPGYADVPGEALPPFPFAAHEHEGAAADEAPLRRTPLFAWHLEHGAKMAPFAGWEMPLWYSTISDEHRAVRGAAGLFDVAHMGIFEITGPHAAYFLNLATTHDATSLRPGASLYAYLLAPDGHVIDDVMVYMLAPMRYVMVVNAANTRKDWAWLTALNRGEVRMDERRPWARPGFRAELADLSAPEAGETGLADLALQGPRSRDILLALLECAPASAATARLRQRLQTLERAQVLEASLPCLSLPGGTLEAIIARTGYTGEPLGYELFVRRGALGALWEQLLEVGAPFGLRPVGLGARDSLRIEAGLPLYGHELAGPLDLRPDDIGFEGYVKLHKPFFVGRSAYIAHSQKRKMGLVRFRIEEKGVRVPKLEDVIADKHGRVIGQVTSCALDTEGYLVGMAFVDARHTEEGSELNVFPRPLREGWEKPYEELELGDRLVLHSTATVVRRFMRK
jgi:glycine hydroxymethyltransferase